MPVELERGILVAVEGIDGSGKTTQVERLVAALRASGLDVVSSKEPTRGRWGTLLRESARSGRLPLDDELHAFVEDRREHVAEVIAPALAARRVVVLDRYYFSTAAYQGIRAPGGHAEQVRFLEEILARNEAFAPEPDRLFLLVVDPLVAAERIRRRDGGGNLFERLEDQRRIAGLFAEVRRPYLVRLDGELPPEEIHRRVLGDLDASGLLPGVRLGPGGAAAGERGRSGAGPVHG